MKKILLLAVFIITFSHTYSQGNYQTDRDFAELQRRFARLQNTGYNPNILNNMYNFHISSYQAKQLASTLRTDREKGEFLYQVFPQVIDPENYLDVVDVFQHFSSALRLYHYTLGSYAMLQNYQNVPTQYPQQYHYQPPVQAPTQSVVPTCDMPADAFQRFINTLENTSFSSSKLNLVKSYINKTCFSTNQISSIMEKFSSDDDKLEVATSLYENCIDRDNYFMLLNNLNFSSSKDKLSQYISSH